MLKKFHVANIKITQRNSFINLEIITSILDLLPLPKVFLCFLDSMDQKTEIEDWRSAVLFAGNSFGVIAYNIEYIIIIANSRNEKYLLANKQIRLNM